MKASLKGKYEYETEKAAATSAISTLAIPAGDLKLRASISDASFVKGPSLNGLSLSVEKPGFFIVDYNVPKQDFRFQFMNSVKVMEKKLNMNYIHSIGDNRTMLDGSLVLDSSNKISVNHTLGSKNGKLKYTYLHYGVTTFEPCYDLGKDSWDFALSQKVYGEDVIKASYQSSSQMLGVEWSRNSKTTGCFKLSAVVNMAEEVKMPKLMAESTWNFEV